MINSLKVIFLGIIPLSSLLYTPSLVTQEISGKVQRVKDADTIVVNSVNIRLAYIDAPEISQKSFDGVMIGEISSKWLSDKILGKHVKVLRITRGKYKRVIGRVFFKGEDINLSLIKSGMALSYGQDIPLEYKREAYKSKMLKKGHFKRAGFWYPFKWRKKRRSKDPLYY